MTKKKKKQENGLNELIMGTVATGLVAGAGSSAIAGIPAFTGQSNIQHAITTATKFTPTIVTLGGAGIVLKKVKKLSKKKKKDNYNDNYLEALYS